MTRVAPALGLLALLAAASPSNAAPPPQSPAGSIDAAAALYPPWNGGDRDGATSRGLEFTVPPVDAMVDFHGNLTNPALVLYASGNYFFALGDLVQAFEAAHPEWRGRIFFETLPPGLLLKQLQAGGTVTSGNLTFTIPPDVMMAEQRASETWVKQGLLTAPVISFASNDLCIMLPTDNPAGITGLVDLSRPDLVLAMPNPAWEGIAGQIRTALVKAGGETLASRVYDEKVAAGTTILTKIHHRQTPLWLMQGIAKAGVTWTSEAIFQEKQGHQITHMLIPPEQNVRAIYSAALVPGAAHPEAAHAWLDFLTTDAAFNVLIPYGFQRPTP
jgi:ABC-type molybdate transport system substrate-binding protein